MKSKGSPPLVLMLLNLQTLLEKHHGFNQTLKVMKEHYNLVLIRADEITEEELLKKLETAPPSLLLLPFPLYQSWRKIGIFLELPHNMNIRYSGYIMTPTSLSELNAPGVKSRENIINFNTINSFETVKIIDTLVEDSQTTGLKPLLDSDTPIYCDHWMNPHDSGSKPGSKIDQLLTIPELAKTEWEKRTAAIRIIFLSLWSFVFEEGRGKLGILQNSAAHNQTPLGYFQIGITEKGLWMRLIYSAPHLRTAQEVLAHFWPVQPSPSSAVALLYGFSDFIRIHALIPSPTQNLSQNSSQNPLESQVSGDHLIEIVVGLTESAPAQIAPSQIRSFWIEPISGQTMIESANNTLPLKAFPQAPQSAMGAGSQPIRLLKTPTDSHLNSKLNENLSGNSNIASLAEAQRSQNQNVTALANELKELKKQLQEKEVQIQILIGKLGPTKLPLPPPDPVALLDAFQQRYSEARFHIRQCELQIEKMRRNGGSTEEITRIKQLIDAMLNREKAWIKKLAQVLEYYRKSHPV